MFDWAKAGWKTGKTSGCRKSSRLEDYVAKVDSGLDSHIESCAECRQALADAKLARQVVRQAERPARAYSDFLVVRVMASIQEEISRRGAETIWKPFELLASKFAMVAAMILFLLGAYLVKSTPRMAPPAATSQTAVGAMIPESPTPPSSPDEIVMSLAGAGQQ